jgi:K(+)-stimulated pyrophosphate-energized sodium pump
MLVKGGVSADRISTAGMGQDHPVASNDTEDGRARNRRLELNVTSK